jgi:hypothetical protein
MMSGWSFGQLQAFVAYKAERCGIRIEYVDPAYTSQTCAQCGALGVRRGDLFSCTTCGKAPPGQAGVKSRPESQRNVKAFRIVKAKSRRLQARGCFRFELAERLCFPGAFADVIARVRRKASACSGVACNLSCAGRCSQDSFYCSMYF